MNKERTATKSVNAETQDNVSDVDNTVEAKPTPDVFTVKGIRASLDKTVVARLEKAEEVNKIDRGILIEMALEYLFTSEKAKRTELYDLVVGRRAAAVVDMDF